MKHGVALRSVLAAGRYRLTGHRSPLAVWITVTTRCDALCATCATPLRSCEERSTEALVELVDRLARRGTRRVVLTGGEPLLRDDIGVIVDRCAGHGMFVQLETNGHAYPERAGELARVGELVIPYDGPEEAHDAAREPGAHAQVLAALGVARARGARVRTRTVLSRHAVPHVGHVLEVAARGGHRAEFQLLQPEPLLSEAVAARHAPTEDALRSALRTLLEARAAGAPVANSEKALRYLLLWPDYAHPRDTAPHEDLHCVAGQLFAAIEPDGRMAPCPMWTGRFPARDSTADLDAAIEAIRDNPCKACTHASLVEYNFLYNLNANALVERARAMLARAPGAP